MLLQDEAGLPQEPATPGFRLNYAEIAMQRTELELQDQGRCHFLAKSGLFQKAQDAESEGTLGFVHSF
jgi:hypothetical protein